MRVWIYRAQRGLPGRFADAWYIALKSEFAQTDTAETELTVVSPGSSAPETTIVLSRGELLWFF